jgi:hypothetical protein
MNSGATGNDGRIRIRPSTLCNTAILRFAEKRLAAKTAGKLTDLGRLARADLSGLIDL